MQRARGKSGQAFAAGSPREFKFRKMLILPGVNLPPADSRIYHPEGFSSGVRRGRVCVGVAEVSIFSLGFWADWLGGFVSYFECRSKKYRKMFRNVF